ncbi:LytR/AlgR family response regulator transcription factor [Aurantibacillus circumpalustris]|uniref:LytR/AlgR family response regulator transcription factor n=1 Tax=Aurantibacillus circumpalustris TaxID=3036359 RepID=UPI00295AD053|nr:LytTR family DNA-binding domain-containing protein [Aurantibacillus circumpalustris]
MLHAVLIDDEYNGLRSLELLIKKFVPEIKVVAQTTDPAEGVELINNYRPDIVFLDINMPSLNGFEVLEKLEHKNFNLIFTTAHQEYAVAAIKKSATDYLLKPIDSEELLNAVQRIQKRKDEKLMYPDIQSTLKEIVGFNNLRVPLPSKDSIEYVTPSMIIYVEANSNGAKIQLTNMMVLEVSKSLKEYESILCKEGLHFIRIHNSFVININYVTRYVKEGVGYVVLQGNKRIPVSKNKKDEFLSHLKLSDDGFN